MERYSTVWRIIEKQSHQNEEYIMKESRRFLFVCFFVFYNTFILLPLPLRFKIFNPVRLDMSCSNVASSLRVFIIRH